MQSWWNVYLVLESFFSWLYSNYIYFSKDDKYNGYAMVFLEHATRGFDSLCLEKTSHATF
jgi:hypothetical protein